MYILIGCMLDHRDRVVTGLGGTEESFSNIQTPLELRRALQSDTDGRMNAASGRDVRSWS